jgi:hypothetical protein
VAARLGGRRAAHARARRSTGGVVPRRWLGTRAAAVRGSWVACGPARRAARAGGGPGARGCWGERARKPAAGAEPGRRLSERAARRWGEQTTGAARGAGTQRVHAGARRQVRELGRSSWAEMAHGGEWNGESSGVHDSRSAERAREAWRCTGASACDRASGGALAHRKWTRLGPGADADS